MIMSIEDFTISGEPIRGILQKDEFENRCFHCDRKIPDNGQKYCRECFDKVILHK
jgi:rRNA maturation endonuclease Nob1